MSINVEEDDDNFASFDEPCVICLSSTLYRPSMVAPCFHSFCTGCISIWLERSDKCPMCNQIAERIIYDIKDKNEYKQISIPSLKGGGRMASETLDNEVNVPNHPSRTRVYSIPMRCSQDDNIHRLKPNRITNESQEKRLREFVIRDLETILRTYRVQILTELVMGMLKTKDFFTSDRESCIHTLKEYLNEKTEHFVEEVELFSRSTLSLPGYDRNVRYLVSAPTLPTSTRSQKRKRQNQVVIDVDDDNQQDDYQESNKKIKK
ncbi:E3 ubiquitin-protein ligase [Acrasis kona]|uniref:RING-type E3 ubiquitin transferase n=1 Tax=Acrasis kona TaxID=1008807 RepID=A0AAW2ZAJ1_9EUKA